MRIFSRLMKLTWKNWILDRQKKGIFAREFAEYMERNQGKRAYGDNARSNAPTMNLHPSTESSKNLDELLNSQMGARDKTGLGYSIQLNEMSNNYEIDSEVSLCGFDVRSSDEESTPANDRSSKADGLRDSLNASAGGNILNRTPRDALTIIENKSKVRTSRNKPVVSRSSATTSSTPTYLPEITALTDDVKAMLLQNKTPSPAPIKAIK
ncbi:hypothetical protein Tco_0217391 [Tanacetum coccineum]